MIAYGPLLLDTNAHQGGVCGHMSQHKTKRLTTPASFCESAPRIGCRHRLHSSFNTMNSTTCHSPRRPRHLTSPLQTTILHHIFSHTYFPTTVLRHSLAATLSMSPRSVQIWFQNQRQKEKREGRQVKKERRSQDVEKRLMEWVRQRVGEEEEMMQLDSNPGNLDAHHHLGHHPFLYDSHIVRCEAPNCDRNPLEFADSKRRLSVASNTSSTQTLNESSVGTAGSTIETAPPTSATILTRHTSVLISHSDQKGNESDLIRYKRQLGQAPRPEDSPKPKLGWRGNMNGLELHSREGQDGMISQEQKIHTLNTLKGGHAQHTVHVCNNPPGGTPRERVAAPENPPSRRTVGPYPPPPPPPPQRLECSLGSSATLAEYYVSPPQVTQAYGTRARKTGMTYQYPGRATDSNINYQSPVQGDWSPTNPTPSCVGLTPFRRPAFNTYPTAFTSFNSVGYQSLHTTGKNSSRCLSSVHSHGNEHQKHPGNVEVDHYSTTRAFVRGGPLVVPDHYSTNHKVLDKLGNYPKDVSRKGDHLHSEDRFGGLGFGRKTKTADFAIPGDHGAEARREPRRRVGADDVGEYFGDEDDVPDFLKGTRKGMAPFFTLPPLNSMPRHYG